MMRRKTEHSLSLVYANYVVSVHTQLALLGTENFQLDFIGGSTFLNNC